MRRSEEGIECGGFDFCRPYNFHEDRFCVEEMREEFGKKIMVVFN